MSYGAVSKNQSDLKAKSHISKKLGRKLEVLDSLESPFGRVVLVSTDLIILLPLLIVTLVVMITVALHTGSRLYAALFKPYSASVADSLAGDRHRHLRSGQCVSNWRTWVVLHYWPLRSDLSDGECSQVLTWLGF